MKANCKTCGEEFSFPPSQGNAKYCSKECWNHRNPPKPIKCMQCGEIFIDYVTAKRVFCSSKCYAEFNSINKTMENSNSWKGGISTHSSGYALVKKPDHPRASSNGYVYAHILIAEKALCKPLPQNAVVHHVDGYDNDKGLVICQDNSYHKLLHERIKAKEGCGDVHKRKCYRCKKWDETNNLIIKKNSAPYHKECMLEYRRFKRAERRLNKI